MVSIPNGAAGAGTAGGAKHWFLVAVLTAAVLLALILPNYHYFFHAELFEQNDFASNSITVRQAKECKAIYGQYSRWGFHHPGPAFLVRP